MRHISALLFLLLAAQPASAQEADPLDFLRKIVDKLTAIEMSGYAQTDWLHYDQISSSGGAALYSDSRRQLFTARAYVKFQHKLGDLMSLTLQPELTETALSLKEAYATIYILDDGALTADVGLFNRPNFEVELSSSAREAAERTQVINAFYPGGRDLGVMFTLKPQLGKDFAPRLQAGVFNGTGTRAEVDPFKDLIARLVLPMPFGDEAPLAMNLGATYYHGGTPQHGSVVRTFDGGIDSIRGNTESGGMAGWGNNHHYGVEAQLNLDLLPFGITMLRAEYLVGQRATPGMAATAPTVIGTIDSAGNPVARVVPGLPATPVTLRRQAGYYAYLIQNIDEWLQLVARFDAFDRNSDVDGLAVRSSSDAASSVLGFGANVFYEKLRLTLFYEIPTFGAHENIRTGDSGGGQREQDVKDNKTTIRLQYRF